MRILAILLLGAFAVEAGADWKVPQGLLGLSTSSSQVARTVDLGRPGALEALEQDRPDHYGKIVEILRIAGDVSCETLPQLLKTQYDVAATRCSSALILTSYPAKRHVWFQLEDTAYVTNVVLKDAGGKLHPAK